MADVPKETEAGTNWLKEKSLLLTQRPEVCNGWDKRFGALNHGINRHGLHNPSCIHVVNKAHTKNIEAAVIAVEMC